ncbi:MAG: hypothetical protein E7364_07455 [Clostridiales bacterium]|nr:hypothetical protein [Clostridiales bacterium]
MKALKKWFPLISLICGAVALVMLFLPCLKVPGESYNGLKAAFGNKDAGFGFSILNTVTFVAAIAGGVLAYLGAKKGNNVMKYVAIACFAVAAIFFFCMVNFSQPSKEIVDLIGKSAAKKMMEESLDLAIGAILGGIFCIVGAASVACDTFIKE